MTHSPQPLHFAASTTGRRPASKESASYGHASTQMPQLFVSRNARQRSSCRMAAPMRPRSGAYGSTSPMAAVGHTSRHLSQNVQLSLAKLSIGVRACSGPRSMPSGSSTSVGHTSMQRAHLMQRAMNSSSGSAPGGRSTSASATKGRTPAPTTTLATSAAPPMTNVLRVGLFADMAKPPLTPLRRRRRAAPECRAAGRIPARAHPEPPTACPGRT